MSDRGIVLFGEEMRTAKTGATRDTGNTKPEYEGYISPLVVQRYGEYMLKHQTQANGEQRTSDNWQKGMPRQWFVDSAYRHFLDLLLYHDGYDDFAEEDLQEALCALLFNISGYLHEVILRRDVGVDNG